MERIIINHITGRLEIKLTGTLIELKDTSNGITGSHTFKTQLEGFRFIGEYFINTSGPTEEFITIFPQFL